MTGIKKDLEGKQFFFNFSARNGLFEARFGLDDLKTDPDRVRYAPKRSGSVFRSSSPNLASKSRMEFWTIIGHILGALAFLCHQRHNIRWAYNVIHNLDDVAWDFIVFTGCLCGLIIMFAIGLYWLLWARSFIPKF